MTAIPGSLASLPGELTYISGGYATPFILEEGSVALAGQANDIYKEETASCS